MFGVTVYATFYGVCKYADVMYVKPAARLRMGAHGPQTPRSTRVWHFARCRAGTAHLHCVHVC